MSDKEEGTRSDAGKGRSLRTMVQEKEGLQRPYPESTGKLVKYLRIEHHDLTSDQKLSQAGEMVQQVEILYRPDDLSSVSGTHVKEEGTSSKKLSSHIYMHTCGLCAHT